MLLLSCNWAAVRSADGRFIHAKHAAGRWPSAAVGICVTIWLWFAYTGHYALRYNSWLTATCGTPLVYSMPWIRCCISLRPFTIRSIRWLYCIWPHAMLFTRKSCQCSDANNIANNHQNNHEIHNFKINKLLFILVIYNYALHALFSSPTIAEIQDYSYSILNHNITHWIKHLLLFSMILQ